MFAPFGDGGYGRGGMFLYPQVTSLWSFFASLKIFALLSIIKVNFASAFAYHKKSPAVKHNWTSSTSQELSKPNSLPPTPYSLSKYKGKHNISNSSYFFSKKLAFTPPPLTIFNIPVIKKETVFFIQSLFYYFVIDFCNICQRLTICPIDIAVTTSPIR